MNICFVSTIGYPTRTKLGGVPTYTRTIAHALAREGHRVFVITHGADKTLTHEQDGPVHVYWAPMGNLHYYFHCVFRRMGVWPRVLKAFEWGWVIRRTLLGLDKRYGVDVVEYPNVWCEGLCHPKQFPMVVRMHTPLCVARPVPGCGDQPGWGTYERLEQSIVRRAALVSCHTSSIAELVAHEYGIARQRIATIPNPVDIEQFRPLPRSACQPPRVFHPGPRLDDWQKGTRVLLQAMDHVLEKLPNAELYVAGRLAGCPVVWHFQSIVSPEAGLGLYRMLVRWWGRVVPDRIVCLSAPIAAQFEGWRRLEEKTVVIWPSVDLEKFRPSHRTPCHQSDVITIGTVARLTPWKGHQVALKAAQLLKSQGFRFRWLFTGDASLGSSKYLAFLRDLVEQWSIGDCVEFVGWIDDISEFYQGLDLFIHVPIEPEPFGMVLIEAMATGLPIVTTTGGGTEEMIEPAGGRLVQPGRARPIVAAVREICTSSQEMLRRGKMARDFAERVLNMEQYMDRWQSIYRSLEVSTRK